MQPRINVITLGVKDLQQATDFYENGLGFPKLDFEGGISFFQLNGSWLSLFQWDLLAQDAQVDAASSGFGGVTLVHNVASEDEVVAALEEAKSAGAVIVKQAQKTDWCGFSGYFADSDGHLWEVSYNSLFWAGPGEFK